LIGLVAHVGVLAILAVVLSPLSSNSAAAAESQPGFCSAVPPINEQPKCIPADRIADAIYIPGPISISGPTVTQVGYLDYTLTVPLPAIPACAYGNAVVYVTPCIESGPSITPSGWRPVYQYFGALPAGSSYQFNGGTTTLRLPASNTRTVLLESFVRIYTGNRFAPTEKINIVYATIGGSPVTGAPTADFTFETNGGEISFRSTSTDPAGKTLFDAWNFDDAGTTAVGANPSHIYTKPGNYNVRLTSTNTDQTSGTVTKVVPVKAPKLGVSIDLLEGAAPPLKPDTPVKARVTVSAPAGGVGALNDIRFTGGNLLEVAPGDAFVISDGPAPPVPVAGFALQPGQKKTFDVTIDPKIIGRYTISSEVTATDETGTKQTATASSPGEIGQALQIEFTFDPPTADQPEGLNGPEPVDMTATIAFKNTTAEAMTDVLFRSLRVDRTKAGQLLAVTQTGGIDPGTEGVSIGALAAGQTKKVTATFRATDDAEVEFSALATAKFANDRTEIGLGKRRWSVKPKYLLALNTRTTNPAAGLLPAGEVARISGTIKNLSTSATVEVGPLYPTLVGNGGSMSLAWDDIGLDPKALTPSQGVTLEPSESRNFTVRILTSYSEPRGISGQLTAGGGTTLTATFTPWGKATFEDGTTALVTPEQIRTTDGDLSKRISIDDSITIPEYSWVTHVAAVTVGGIEGLWNAACSMVTGLIDLAKLPYTVLVAAAEIQAQVWKESTPAERILLVADTTAMGVAILLRSAKNGAEALPDLYKRVNDYTLKAMTDMENDWQIGDWTNTARLWSSYGADAIGQVVIPIALAKIAKAPATVAVLARVQEALNARMAPLVGRAATATRIEELVPILESLASGTELLPTQLETLYGITEAEYAALKKIGDDLGILMTVRSRHETSIKWIRDFAAKLKPEALKIKSISEMDTKLGYRASDIGRLVFKKPKALIAFEKGEGSIGEAMGKVAAEAGFEPGSMEWQNAFDRQMLRVKEWRKYEKEYKRLDSQGWIDVSVDYGSNAAVDSLANAKSSLGVSKVNLGKYEGFQLRSVGPVGEEEYVVEMFNRQEGRFVPITGDIDPIAFTHLDGSALTAAEHARVLDAMRLDPLLQAQHGESATFVKGGVEFTVNQFKPGEPGLQIAPGSSLPRVVRINAEKSRWANPFDYHIHMDGGFVYSGSYIPRTASPLPAYVVPTAAIPALGKVRALPAATTAAANVGRCRVTYGTPIRNINTIVDTQGKLARLAGPKNNQVQEDPALHSQCFSAGPDIPLVVSPSTVVLEGTAVDEVEVEIPTGEQGWGEQSADLRIGDQVVIGAGGATAETRTITAFGSIIVDRPLEFAHEAGEAIVVTAMVPRESGGGTTTTTVTPTVPSTTNAPSTTIVATTVPATAGSPAVQGITTTRSGAQSTPAPASSNSGSGAVTAASLAVTGNDSSRTAGLAFCMAGLGIVLMALAKRRVRQRHQPR